MNFITNFDLFLNEEVDFFQKGKVWSVNGKKVKVVGSIPQNPQVLKFQELDKDGNTIGKQFVAKKGDVKGWTEPITSNKTESENNKTDDLMKQEIGKEKSPEIENRYKELISIWRETQKRLGKNTSPGEGTRNRLLKQAESEINFDETTDVDKDLNNLKRRPSYEVVDRLTSLIKSKKVKDLKNIVRYLDFTKSKMNAGDSIRMNPN
jgi:hypothetical protein